MIIMVFPDVAKNKVRDEIDSVLSYGVLGTGSTDESVSDTGLEAAQTNTSGSVTTQTADKALTVDFSLNATDGNGVAYTEFGVFSTDDTLMSRHVFSSLTKASTEQWQLSVIYKVS